MFEALFQKKIRVYTYQLCILTIFLTVWETMQTLVCDSAFIIMNDTVTIILLIFLALTKILLTECFEFPNRKIKKIIFLHSIHLQLSYSFLLGLFKEAQRFSNLSSLDPFPYNSRVITKIIYGFWQLLGITNYAGTIKLSPVFFYEDLIVNADKKWLTFPLYVVILNVCSLWAYFVNRTYLHE